MKTNPVTWFEIYVQEMDRAKTFYESVFGVTLEKLTSPDPAVEMLAFPMDMASVGAGGGLVKIAGVPSGGSTLVYFGCEDCGVEEAKALAAGGQVKQTKMAIGEYGFMTLVIDPEGNTIGLHSMQ
jgi:uncharacterized protein